MCVRRVPVWVFRCEGRRGGVLQPCRSVALVILRASGSLRLCFSLSLHPGWANAGAEEQEMDQPQSLAGPAPSAFVSRFSHFCATSVRLFPSFPDQQFSHRVCQVVLRAPFVSFPDNSFYIMSASWYSVPIKSFCFLFVWLYLFLKLWIFSLPLPLVVLPISVPLSLG